MPMVEAVERFLLERGYGRAERPPPQSLPVFRDMWRWRHKDDPDKDVGLVVKDGRVSDASWNLLIEMLRRDGESVD